VLAIAANDLVIAENSKLRCTPFFKFPVGRLNIYTNMGNKHDILFFNVENVYLRGYKWNESVSNKNV
jgi:hypothetical protein